MQSSTTSIALKAEKKFAIVSFPDEDELMFIVASQWLSQNEFSQYSCLWPPYISEKKVRSSVIKNEKPDHTWQKYKANLVIKCKTYEDAESIRNSIMKISPGHSKLIFDHLKESTSSQQKPPSIEFQLKNCVFPESTLLVANDIIAKLINMNIGEVSFSLKDVFRTVSAESSINLPDPHISKTSTSCQTEQVQDSSNTVCDSCKSKASIFKPPTATSFTAKRDAVSVGNRLDCITCTKEHEDKCLEEYKVTDSISRINAENDTSFETTFMNDFSYDEFEDFKPMFGSAGTNGSATLSWSAVKFKPPTETNVVIKGNASTYVGTRLQCITCMKEYEDKSFEELRMGDLCLGVNTHSQFVSSAQKTTQLKSMSEMSLDTNVFVARWTANKFKPPTETNVTVIAEIPFFNGTRLQCITCMKEYEDKSLEELRVEDSSNGRLRTSLQPSNPFRATHPFSSTFAFTVKKPNRKPRIYPLLFGNSGTQDEFTGIGASKYPVIKFTPVTGSDTIVKAGKEIPVKTQLQSITCMKEYVDKSFEELRMDDRIAGRCKSSSPVRMIFGTPAPPTHLNRAHQTMPSTIPFSRSNSKPLFTSTVTEKTGPRSYPVTKFQPVTGSDIMIKKNQIIRVSTRLQSITCLKEYEDKSFEELRFEGFISKHKESSSVGESVWKSDKSSLIGNLSADSDISFSEIKYSLCKSRTELSSYPANKFVPVTESDTMIKSGKAFLITVRLQSITCMKEYQDKSFEELRVEDLVVAPKVRSPIKTAFRTHAQSVPVIGASTTASSFTFCGDKSKPDFDFNDTTRLFKKCTNESTFGENVQPFWDYSPFYVSSSLSETKTLRFK